MSLRERYRAWRKRREIWPSSGTCVIGTQMDPNYDPPSDVESWIRQHRPEIADE